VVNFHTANGVTCSTKRSDIKFEAFDEPATSTHILNILPTSMIYLQKLGGATSTEQQTGKQSVVLRTVDIKDAFLMFDQGKPMAVSLHNKLYRVKKNVPGQRLGAKMWYWIFRDFLNKHLDMHWCIEKPCMAKNRHCCVMVHVDDVMFCGDGWYWENVFLKKLKEHYNISHSQLQGVGSEITFLKGKSKDWNQACVSSQVQKLQR